MALLSLCISIYPIIPESISYFLVAAVCKFTACVSVYPHGSSGADMPHPCHDAIDPCTEVVRTRVRERSDAAVRKYRGFFQTLKVRRRMLCCCCCGLILHVMSMLGRKTLVDACFSLYCSLCLSKKGRGDSMQVCC